MKATRCPKRSTRASIARERGLQPLADLILAQPHKGDRPDIAAQAFLNDAVPTLDDALIGARDIAAETINDHAEVRRQTREKALRFAMLTATRIEGSADEKGVYTLYYDFASRIDRLKPYQVLALNRGEAQKVLRLNVDIPERDWRQSLQNVFPDHPLSSWAEQYATESARTTHGAAECLDASLLFARMLVRALRGETKTVTTPFVTSDIRPLRCVSSAPAI